MPEEKLKCKWEDKDGNKLCLSSRRFSTTECEGYDCNYYQPVEDKEE